MLVIYYTYEIPVGVFFFLNCILCVWISEIRKVSKVFS